MASKRGKVLIIAGVSAFLAVAVGAYLITAPPYSFVKGGKLWLAQSDPTDPNLVVLIYAHPAKPAKLVHDAEMELGAKPKIEFLQSFDLNEPGTRPYDPKRDWMKVTDWKIGSQFVGNKSAYFEAGLTQITIDTGDRYFLGCAMFKRCANWPKDVTMIAIRQPTSVLGRIQMAVFSLGRQRLSATDIEVLSTTIQSDQVQWDQIRQQMEEQFKARLEKPIRKRGGDKIIP